MFCSSGGGCGGGGRLARAVQRLALDPAAGAAGDENGGRHTGEERGVCGSQSSGDENGFYHLR